MKIDVRNLTEPQLENLIANHRKRGARDAETYREALSELEARRGKGLEFETSMAVIKQAAREGRFLSYKELADSSGADWARVHYAIGSHLWKLVDYADTRGWPMLSAIVVNKPNVATGRMEPETLKGFVAAARELGHEILDEEAFLREQQQRVFEWAQSDLAEGSN